MVLVRWMPAYPPLKQNLPLLHGPWSSIETCTEKSQMSPNNQINTLKQKMDVQYNFSKKVEHECA